MVPFRPRHSPYNRLRGTILSDPPNLDRLGFVPKTRYPKQKEKHNKFCDKGKQWLEYKYMWAMPRNPRDYSWRGMRVALPRQGRKSCADLSLYLVARTA